MARVKRGVVAKSRHKKVLKPKYQLAIAEQRADREIVCGNMRSLQSSVVCCSSGGIGSSVVESTFEVLLKSYNLLPSLFT